MKRVALVHGFLGSPADWADVLARLSPGIACDCVPLVELGCASVADAARALAARLERSPCDALVGYSMGGRIALELAATRPELAPRLVLLAASPGLDDEAERARRAAEDDARAEEILRDGLDAFVERWYRLAIFAPFTRHASFSAARLRRAQGEAEFWSRCVAACSPARGTPRWSAIPALAPRTTFVAGALDERYAAFAARARDITSALAPALRVEIIAGAGHVLPLEAPDACARIIEESLSLNPSAQS
ncbi:MAG: alpha/beta fold hydrolase [Planctomycetota bacterium]|nr:alpha/beta fold hydrolase [Planctomycetota bacterium]